jgi:Uma2 family endonuclease
VEVEIYRFHESADAPIAVMRSGETVTTSLLPDFELAVAEIFAQ